MRSFKKWVINLRISESEIGAATIFKNSEGNSGAQAGLRTTGITTLALPIMFNMFNVKMYIIPKCRYAVHKFIYTQKDKIKIYSLLHA